MEKEKDRGEWVMKQGMAAVKTALEKKLSWIVGAIVVIQPLLDVLSYFLQEMGSNSLTTALRFLMLAGVALLGFLVSDRKKLYFIFYGVVVVYWITHMLNCFRVGYQSPVSDAGAFSRIMNFPVFALSFITFFEKGKDVRRVVVWGFAINLLTMVLFTVLPWATGNPVYTYDELYIGVMGWFAVENSQSTILVLVAPVAIYGAYRLKKYPLFLLAVLLSFGMLFVTGTKFTFYSIFIIAGAFIFLFVMNLRKQSIRYVTPLLAVLVLVVAFRQYSPMQQRESQYAYSQGIYQQIVEDGLRSSGTDAETLEAIRQEVNQAKEDSSSNKQSSNSGKETEEEYAAETRLGRMREGLISVYTDPDGYGPILEDMTERFGIYNVMEIYDYTSASYVLSDFRVLKSRYAELMWEEKDTLTHLLGSEAQDMITSGFNYDLENDFPAVFYSCGYIGFALYMLSLLAFFGMILRAFALDVSAAWQEQKGKKRRSVLRVLGALGGGIQRFLTVEMGAVGMTFLLAVISGLISGNTLRRPNVTVYFAISAAYLCYLTFLQRKEPLFPRKKEKADRLKNTF